MGRIVGTGPTSFAAGHAENYQTDCSFVYLRTHVIAITLVVPVLATMITVQIPGVACGSMQGFLPRDQTK